MPKQTLEQLLTTRELEQVRTAFSDWMMARAATDPSVAVITAWASGDAMRSLLELSAEVYWRLEKLIPELAKSGFVDLAAGDWLDYLAESHYSLTREASVFALDQIVLTAEPGAGPYTIDLNQLWAVTRTGLRYNTVTDGVLATGSTLTLQVIAEHPGSSYNVPRGAINKLLTPLSGVEISNPTMAGLVRAGADTESDARLRRRCKLRWDELAAVPTRKSYEAFALKASSSITKVLVADNNPRGPGTVDIIVAGAGGVGSSVCTDDRINPPTTNTSPFYGAFTPGAVNAYAQARRGIGSSLYAYPATIVNITITATIQVLTGFRPQAEPRILANLVNLEKNLEIGGLLRRNNIIDALLEGTLGTVAVDLVLPSADEQLSPASVAVIVPNLTWIEV